jgi:hypothetical protein
LVVGRRDALVQLGLAWAGVALGRPPSGASAGWAAGGPVEADALLKLAARIRDGSRDAAWDAAQEWARAGAAPERLLAAVFLAGVESIRPRPHGILHAVMMVESACQLAAADPRTPRAGFHPALFNLDDLKTAQEEDRREWADYAMKPLASRRRGGVDGAERELEAALDAFDAERAEHAAAALAAQVDAGAFFERLRPYTARCYAFIGHKAIYATQVERALRRVGWQHAESAVRSLCLALLVERDTEGYARSRELAVALPPSGRPSVPRRRGDTVELQEALRSAAPGAAAETVAEALRSGTPADAAWDAIVLNGAELFQRRTGRRSVDGRAALLPVHAVTVPSALRHSAGRSRDAGTRGLLLLQAAAWSARLRADLDRSVGLAPAEPLTAPHPEIAEHGASSLDAVLEQASPVLAAGWLAADTRRSETLLAAMRRSLARRGREHHQHKLAAALAEEASTVEASLCPGLLAPAVDYLAHPRDAETEVFRRAERVLDAAGLPR